MSQKHEREIPHYEGDIKGLGRKVARLTFDQDGTFIRAHAQDLAEQSEAGAARGRTKLAAELASAAELLQAAALHIDEAWRISAPHMTPQERGEDPA